MDATPTTDLKELQRLLFDKFTITISLSSISRKLKALNKSSSNINGNANGAHRHTSVNLLSGGNTLAGDAGFQLQEQLSMHHLPFDPSSRASQDSSHFHLSSSSGLETYKSFQPSIGGSTQASHDHDDGVSQLQNYNANVYGNVQYGDPSSLHVHYNVLESNIDPNLAMSIEPADANHVNPLSNVDVYNHNPELKPYHADESHDHNHKPFGGGLVQNWERQNDLSNAAFEPGPHYGGEEQQDRHYDEVKVHEIDNVMAHEQSQYDQEVDPREYSSTVDEHGNINIRLQSSNSDEGEGCEQDQFEQEGFADNTTGYGQAQEFEQLAYGDDDLNP